MSLPNPSPLFAAISDELAQLERMLQDGSTLAYQPAAALSPGVSDGRLDRSAVLLRAMDTVQDLRRRLDRLSALYHTSRQLSSTFALQDVLTQIVDTFWQEQQYSFVVVLLGETELGPYIYREMRGVVDPRRFLGKQCPLPLWGELAHALVRRLDPNEPDYLVIADLAKSDHPRPQEFPWLQRQGTLMILPLRKDNVAIGALLIGRRETNGFDNPELCAALLEIAASAAAAVYHAQIQQDLEDRGDQLVGLQLYTKSLTEPTNLGDFLLTIANGTGDLLSNADAYVLLLRRMLRTPLVDADAWGVDWGDFFVVSNRGRPDFHAQQQAGLYRLATWTIESGQPLFLNPSDETGFPDDLYYNDAGRALLVPIVYGEETLGLIYAVAPEEASDFNEHDMVTLRTMANSAALAIELGQHL